MESTQSSIGFGSPDRGVCRVCGRVVRLVHMTGYVYRHRDPGGEPCPGGAKPPLRPGDEQTIELPD